MSGVFRLLGGASAVLLLASTAAAGQAGDPASAPVAEPAAEPAAPVVPVDAVAEAYRLFTEGRMAERAREAEAAAAAYRRAAELDPQSVGPLVALASLHFGASDGEEAERTAREAAERDPAAAAPHQILGSLYFRQLRSGDPEAAERAIEAFTEAVRLDPDDLESRSALARLLASARRGEEAAAHFRELTRRAPDPYHELFLLARLRLADGDREQAFDYALQSLRIEPRQPDARELLDSLLLDPQGVPGRSPEEAFREAAALYESAAAEHPDDAEVRQALAEALYRVGRLEESAAAFEQVVEAEPDDELALMGLARVRQRQARLRDAEEVLGRVLEGNPRHLPARDALGGVYLARCEYESAAGEFRALLELPKDSYGLARRRDFLVRYAHARQELGDHAAALEALGEARSLSEGRSDALRFRVMEIHGLLAAGEAGGAVSKLAEVREHHEDTPGLAALEARVLSASGRPAEALALLLRLAGRSPDQPGPVHELLRHQVDQGDYAAAEAVVRDWLAERPEDISFRFQLGAVLERQGRREEAEAEFRRVLERAPDHALSLNYLGYMLAEDDRRLEESESLIRRALEEDPHNGSYRDSLGWVQFRRGLLDLAEPNLLAAARCMPENSVVLDHLGDLYRAKGNADEAVRFWRRALEHDGEAELERDAVARKIEEAADERR